jgi:iron(III) transport system substrate-binding protein
MKIASLLLFFILWPVSAWPASEDFFQSLGKLSPQERERRLVEGAKKEGEVMLYSSSGLEEIRTITNAFGKKYPFIHVKFMRKGGSQLLNVAVMEYRARQYMVDTYWAGVSTLGPIVKQERGMLARYQSPERKFIPAEFKDQEGYWTATRTSVAIFAYHSKKVPPKMAPNTYADLLDPFWKGKLAIDTSPARFPALLVERMGWANAEEYMRKLAQQELKLHRGRSARVQIILAGEVLGSLDINADNIVELQFQNAPLEYALMDPTFLSLTALSMPRNPPHPHAATLFYDYIISKEGQKELSQENNVPVRDDVQVRAKDLVDRMKKARQENRFIVQSPGTYDPAVEEKLDRLYIETLVKKPR